MEIMGNGYIFKGNHWHGNTYPPSHWKLYLERCVLPLTEKNLIAPAVSIHGNTIFRRIEILGKQIPVCKSLSPFEKWWQNCQMYPFTLNTVDSRYLDFAYLK